MSGVPADPELGSFENPHKWPYGEVEPGEWIRVTTGPAKVESVDNQGMTVVSEKGQRQWLAKNYRE